jgi:gamma-glutamylcyclotransferase (GGCT)/AIG2-like uncharacterized protein YtfP
MTHLFVYGTLMCEDIMQEVSGCLPEHRRGVLEGYTRLRVREHVYPGLLQRTGNRVDGVVYLNVPASAYERLDRFEGEMYTRRTVSIDIDGGGRLTAETYVMRPEQVDRLEEAEWDFSEFLSGGKSKFRAGYAGYRSIAYPFCKIES